MRAGVEYISGVHIEMEYISGVHIEMGAGCL